MLKPTEYMPHAPDIPGDSRRINHNTARCSGSSNSMTIRMDDHGVVHAKCWRCGEYGKTGGQKPSNIKRAPKNKRKNFDIPDDIVYSWKKMPVEAIVYLNKHNFTEGELAPYGVGWSFKEDCLVLPATNFRNPEAGWQGKYFGRKQRYTTVTRTPQELYTHLCQPVGVDRTPGGVVITEDLLSAVRVRGSRVLSSFALLGTELNHTALNELTWWHQKFYVWLDNDNSTVNKKARDIANQLSLYGDTILIKELQEPKELSKQEITAVLYKYNKNKLNFIGK